MPTAAPTTRDEALDAAGTSSFHEATKTLGFESLCWGGPAIRQSVETAMRAGRRRWSTSMRDTTRSPTSSR